MSEAPYSPHGERAMNPRAFLLAGVSALFGLCLAFMFIGSTAAQAPVAKANTPTIGRYQMTAWFGATTAAAQLYMIDTTTGECWEKTGSNAVWQPALPPISRP